MSLRATSRRGCAGRFSYVHITVTKGLCLKNCQSRSDRLIARCRALAAFTEVPGETTRTFLSEPMHAVHDLVRAWMEAAGMCVDVDAMGNLRGVYMLQRVRPRRVLLIASHLDTVPNAGIAFDGILGVLFGVALVEELQGEQLPFAIEVIGFSEEEGVRFGKPFLGSLALIGAIDDAWLAVSDTQEVGVGEAIRELRAGSGAHAGGRAC